MSLAMSEHERQAFLAGVHVGVISIEREDGPPLTVPIWYGYEPGGNVWVTTGTDSLKSKLLHMAHRYFGAELGDLYVESIKGEASLTWTMLPERWWSVDYSKTGRVDPRTT